MDNIVMNLKLGCSQVGRLWELSQLSACYFRRSHYCMSSWSHKDRKNLLGNQICHKNTYAFQHGCFLVLFLWNVVRMKNHGYKASFGPWFLFWAELPKLHFVHHHFSNLFKLKKISDSFSVSVVLQMAKVTVLVWA